jgi:hypothetical protein
MPKDTEIDLSDDVKLAIDESLYAIKWEIVEKFYSADALADALAFIDGFNEERVRAKAERIAAETAKAAKEESQRREKSVRRFKKTLEEKEEKEDEDDADVPTQPVPAPKKLDWRELAKVAKAAKATD